MLKYLIKPEQKLIEFQFDNNTALYCDYRWENKARSFCKYGMNDYCEFLKIL